MKSTGISKDINILLNICSKLFDELQSVRDLGLKTELGRGHVEGSGATDSPVPQKHSRFGETFYLCHINFGHVLRVFGFLLLILIHITFTMY